MRGERSRPTLPLRAGETASKKTKETGKRSAPFQSAERKLALPEAVAGANLEKSKSRSSITFWDAIPARQPYCRLLVPMRMVKLTKATLSNLRNMTSGRIGRGWQAMHLGHSLAKPSR